MGRTAGGLHRPRLRPWPRDRPSAGTRVQSVGYERLSFALPLAWGLPDARSGNRDRKGPVYRRAYGPVGVGRGTLEVAL